ncbi:DUF3108 domain-containing protein [candidate division KSB1 bacterium]|nr:DUF3108 domain-containing protein [candidate division KSB1 bacterium]
MRTWLLIFFIFLPNFVSARECQWMNAGETLEYSIEYLHWDAGRMIITLYADSINQCPVNKVYVDAKTRGIASRLFRVNNQYETCFTQQTFLPLTLHKWVTQKNIMQQRCTIFNHITLLATIDSTQSWAIPADTRDFFSMLYFLRATEWDDTLRFHVDAERLLSQANAVHNGTELIKCCDEKMEVERIDMSFDALTDEERPWDTDLLTNRLSQPNSTMTIRISTDDRRLPVKFEFHQSPFDLVMTLKAYKTNSVNHKPH